MEFNFRFSLTEDEFLEYNVYSGWSAPWQKGVRLKAYFTYFILCLVFSLFAAFAASKTGKKSSQLLFIVPVALIISAITSYVAYSTTKYTIQKRIKKFMEKEENKHILSECELTINEKQIVDKNIKSTSFYLWESIVRYAVTEKYFYLYLNSINGLIIPKRLLSSEKEISALDKLIQERIPLSSSFRSLGL